MSKTAIVLAAFGVSLPEALPGITNVVQRVRQSFACPVEVCFTSNIVRGMWQKRLADPQWVKDNHHTPDYVRRIKGPLATIAALQDSGHKTQIIQPLHVYAGEEYHDLRNFVAALASIETIKPKWRPFQKVMLGRPALGEPGVKHPYLHDIERAAQALDGDVQEAREMGAALVYVGHGNHVFSTGVYHEMQMMLQQRHPDVAIEIGAVEGMFGVDYVAGRLSDWGVMRVLLKPLMLVAGVHARDDMAGGAKDSWRSVLAQMGFRVECRLQGLGEIDAWAGIYVQNINECAAEAGIELECEAA
ncbi:MAG: sirohydrochlorin cobaltochelatase [Deltaproteobacteria bacterium]|nr:sirohydrochlorin cobaltochelatase [Deltaproteobacteria bacterium]